MMRLKKQGELRVLSVEELKIESDAIKYAKRNRNDIAIKHTDKSIFLPEAEPVSVFMAGSPGAGKTEASIELINNGSGQSILRIDPDELRHEFEEYEGHNSYLFQRGVSILLERIHDKALRQRQSFILDGTLSNYGVAVKNIERSIKRNRFVQILYVYQEPMQAWKFVQARENFEGRKILLRHFINQYFEARNVVNQLKIKFDNAINIDLLLKNTDGTNRIYKDNIERIDNHIQEKYTPETLELALKR